ncbi:hypothetical protein RCH18_002306 [Flavobacterium sp. PL11]|uniref:DUF6250 domain-containing protein n=1 Tax=Flavobacterium sp. PL11 TaxID=3071717 RepID=UPI002E011A75|nr:hypothetical protein [Flavobacterium sp. PL11]
MSVFKSDRNEFKYLKLCFFICITIASISCNSLSEVNFNRNLLTANNWIIEQQPGGKVEFSNNVMEITDAKGCTLWFKHKLSAPITIEYDATVINANGPLDRVSDLNCFWMANDPKNPNDFFKESKNRQGLFPNYHELTQYYVGYGGHDNTKTRFRRYDGNKDRPLLPEHDLDDKKFMIVPNKKLHITLIVNKNQVKYLRDGEIIFEIVDKSPYLSGYFGIRTVENHMKIENLKISK